MLKLSSWVFSFLVLMAFLRRFDKRWPVRGICARKEMDIPAQIKHKISSFPTARKWFIY
jgi:hypothetical protein